MSYSVSMQDRGYRMQPILVLYSYFPPPPFRAHLIGRNPSRLTGTYHLL